MFNIFTLFIFIIASCFVSKASWACPPAALRINDNTWVTATGLESSIRVPWAVGGMKLTVQKGVAAVFDLSDRENNLTHKLEYLGGVEHTGGIIQSIFLITDLITKVEKTIILKGRTILSGDSMQSADAPTVTKDLNDF